MSSPQMIADAVNITLHKGKRPNEYIHNILSNLRWFKKTSLVPSYSLSCEEVVSVLIALGYENAAIIRFMSTWEDTHNENGEVTNFTDKYWQT
eukprot:5671316-Prorocentrum_lima.AAC.1